jgi:hypothetical protein
LGIAVCGTYDNEIGVTDSRAGGHAGDDPRAGSDTALSVLVAHHDLVLIVHVLDAFDVDIRFHSCMHFGSEFELVGVLEKCHKSIRGLRVNFCVIFSRVGAFILNWNREISTRRCTAGLRMVE